MKLLEDSAKAWLRKYDLPVPSGYVAHTPEEAAHAARTLGGRVAIKALVAAGRRGKAGGVKIAQGPLEAQVEAQRILGIEIAGQRTNQLYVESAIDIASEYYLSFGFGRLFPQVVVSQQGGVDIEAVAASNRDAIIMADVNPIDGLPVWRAADLWDRAGVESKLVPALASMTARLYEAFRDADALILEVNPIAASHDGGLSIVGTMLEIDPNALFRHALWQDVAISDCALASRALNERERAVIDADRKFQGGAIRYTELPGDIALFLAGGGAGLLQHDLVLAAGGRPANHSDLSPAAVEKPAALFDAMFSNPSAKGLLIGMNYQQMLPCTLIIEALLLSIKRNGVDPRHFPIVVRLFGPKEEEARQLAATVPGIRYLPHGATLEEGVCKIVVAVQEVRDGKC